MKKSDVRNVLEKAAWGKLRQGVVFNGVLLDHYDGCEVYGLIITAHCDLVQDKTTIINFVPVVSLSDWLLRDGARILSKRNKADLNGRVKSLIKRQGLSETLLDVHTLDEIIEVHFETQVVKKGKTPRQEAVALRDSLEVCDAILDTTCSSSAEAQRLVSINTASYERFIAECMSQKVAGYYFLSGVEIGRPDSGYVALLRQIYHLPAIVGQAMSNGIDVDLFRELSAVYPSISAVLSIHADEFIMPLSQIRSPYLEHLMQAFGMLYMRVGVPDLASGYINEVSNSLRGEKR